MTTAQTIGVLPLGRSTFDVPYATEKLKAMLHALDSLGHTLVGSRELLFDTESTRASMAELEQANLDQLLILQVTFTDAVTVAEAANRFAAPLSIWAVPEPRLGGRLRLNAFCGLNLASHALGLNHRQFGWLYADASEAIMDDVRALLQGQRLSGDIAPVDASVYRSDAGTGIVQRLAGKRIGCIGDPPDGFFTCAYDASTVQKLTGVQVEKIPLKNLFDAARNADTSATERVAEIAETTLSGLDSVNPGELDKSYRLKIALDTLKSSGKFDAFAIRCWPETFTEYGGAVCGPISMLGDAMVPCACEADVYGAMSQLLLQEVANEPVFLVDMVDIDQSDNSTVVWHCGQAPVSMADPDLQPAATIHTNRKMPLLYEFPLKPGRITVARVSQAKGKTKLIISGGNVIKHDMAYTGTSGVIRFDTDAAAFLGKVIDSGLEHHVALVYGDYLDVLRATATALQIPLIEL